MNRYNLHKYKRPKRFVEFEIGDKVCHYQDKKARGLIHFKEISAFTNEMVYGVHWDILSIPDNRSYDGDDLRKLDE